MMDLQLLPQYYQQKEKFNSLILVVQTAKFFQNKVRNTCSEIRFCLTWVFLKLAYTVLHGINELE